MACIPSRLTAGDSWSLPVGGTDHPSPQWAVALVLVPEAAGSTALSLAATWSGSDWTVDVTASASALITPGPVAWRVLATDVAGDARETLDAGRAEVLPDPVGGGDLRSAARRHLEAIDAVLADPSWLGAESYTIEGRSLARRSRADLMALRAVWAAKVRAEDGRGLFATITPRLAR